MPMSKTITLRNMKDGGTIDIVDEGPFSNRDDPNAHRSGSPSGGRQRVLSLLKKKQADGAPLWQPVTDVSDVFDQAAGSYLAIPTVPADDKPAPKAEPAADSTSAAPAVTHRARGGGGT